MRHQRVKMSHERALVTLYRRGYVDILPSYGARIHYRDMPTKWECFAPLEVGSEHDWTAHGIGVNWKGQDYILVVTEDLAKDLGWTKEHED